MKTQEMSELKKEISTLKKEMKANGVRITSCFNGGLTSAEMRFNSQLFALKTKLSRIQST